MKLSTEIKQLAAILKMKTQNKTIMKLSTEIKQLAAILKMKTQNKTIT